jgi:tetratricopeptide (TPR) repeat protein
MHLAAGRGLVQGERIFDAPRAPSAGHLLSSTWLYDVLTFGLYSFLGGVGLVLIKALLVVGLALLLMRMSWARQGWWLPALCTALALMAMSNRVLLQPATLSYFLMALTLSFIWEREQPSVNLRQYVFSAWPLFLLFIVWVNTDSGFLLGLATVALVWLGEGLDESLGAETLKGSWRVTLLGPCCCLALLAAASLINQAMLAAFTSGPFGNPDWFTTGFASGASPFQRISFGQHGLSPAAIAYFSLLVLTLLSFVLYRSHRTWQRLLPWLGMALLSVFQVRAVPYFAVVAGPVLARNLQDLFVHNLESGRWQSQIWSRRVLAWQGLTIVFVLVLAISAWPGWLQSASFEPRRWAIETQPSLEQGALATRRWLEQANLGPEVRGLHMSPETADVFAWFCPQERSLRDDRLAVAIRGDSGGHDNWAERMRSAGINHIILYDADRGKLFTALDKLLTNSREWPILFMQGNVVVFGWRDPTQTESADPFRDWQADYNSLAFRPAEDKKAPREAPEREPEVRPWWEAFWKRAPSRPLDQDEATLHLFHAEALRQSAPFRHKIAWEEAHSAALLGASATWAGLGGPVDAYLRLTLLRPVQPGPGSQFGSLPVLDQQAYGLQQDFALHRDDTPPSLLFLAVRGARRAIAVNPDDAQAYLVLGESYLRLLKSTRERIWGERLAELVQLRRTQAAAALNQAISLKPNFAQAHLSLSRLYGEMGQLDLALDHFRTYTKIIHEAGAPPDVTAEQFREQEASYEGELTALAKEVKKRNDTHTVVTADMRVLERAFTAWQDGLTGKARDLLLQSDLAAFGPKGMALELDLLLKTGRPRPVLRWIGPDQEQTLGTQTYHWLRLQALAALGDYALAQEECNLLAQPSGSSPQGQESAGIRQVMAILICQRVLGEGPGGISIPEYYKRKFDQLDFHNRLARLAQVLRREADVTVLRGLLALEEGEIDEAEIAFRTALSSWNDSTKAASGSGFDFNARVVAQDCLEWLARKN